MDKTRIKNNGYHDVLVEADAPGMGNALFIRQHGREPSVVVVSLCALPMLIAALQEKACG